MSCDPGPEGPTPAFLALVRASAAQAARDAGGLERELREVADGVAGGVLTPLQVEEALLQSHLFLGYPAALEALALWRQVSGLPPDPGSEHLEGEAALRRPRIRGPRTFDRVYGEAAGPLLSNVEALHPVMARWMVEEGYGRVLGRPGLDLRDRELLVATLLAVQDAPRQLHSHLRGALRVGVPPEHVEATLAALEPWVPDPGKRARIRARWADVQARAGLRRGDTP